MRHVVGVSDMTVSNDPSDVVVTHSLGSCVGVAVWDPFAIVGGILHFQLPSSTCGHVPPQENPCMYADTGITSLFRAAASLGAAAGRMKVRLSGGASVLDSSGTFNIGVRNLTAARRVLWKHGILVSAEDVGGDFWRTMVLDISSGRLTIKTSDSTYEL